MQAICGAGMGYWEEHAVKKPACLFPCRVANWFCFLVTVWPAEGGRSPGSSY